VLKTILSSLPRLSIVQNWQWLVAAVLACPIGALCVVLHVSHSLCSAISSQLSQSVSNIVRHVVVVVSLDCNGRRESSLDGSCGTGHWSVDQMDPPRSDRSVGRSVARAHLIDDPRPASAVVCQSVYVCAATYHSAPPSYMFDHQTAHLLTIRCLTLRGAVSRRAHCLIFVPLAPPAAVISAVQPSKYCTAGITAAAGARGTRNIL